MILAGLCVLFIAPSALCWTASVSGARHNHPMLLTATPKISGCRVGMMGSEKMWEARLRASPFGQPRQTRLYQAVDAGAQAENDDDRLRFVGLPFSYLSYTSLMLKLILYSLCSILPLSSIALLQKGRGDEGEGGYVFVCEVARGRMGRAVCDRIKKHLKGWTGIYHGVEWNDFDCFFPKVLRGASQLLVRSCAFNTCFAASYINAIIA